MECVKIQYTAWGNKNVANNVREFWFKFLSNSLAINVRVSHFAEISRACTFCEIVKKNLPAMEETFSHLFFYCDTTNRQLKDWKEILISEFLPLGKDDRKKFWFTIGEAEAWQKNGFLMWARILILYKIWEQKIQKTIRPFHRLRLDILQDLKELTIRDSRVKNSGLRLNIRFSQLFFQNEQHQE